MPESLLPELGGEPAAPPGLSPLGEAHALYRKYRPQALVEVVGQEPIIRTLLNALASGRVAHAYLFAGPRGTGKTSTGRILAKALNCLANGGQGEPCNACESCRAIAEGRALDLVEMDAASNRGIDEIRRLRDRVNFAPTQARFKVYIVDEVHMLTPEAFNALLKTLEEPPGHVVFILATTEVHKVPATILSRCQRFDFRRIAAGAVVARLQHIAAQENIAVEEAGLHLIARAATGSLRDATNLLQQAATFYGWQIGAGQVEELLGLVRDERVLRLAQAALAARLAEGLTIIQGVAEDGLDLRLFQRQLLEQLRLLLLLKSGAGAAVELSEGERSALEELARGASLHDILVAIRYFSQADLRQDAYSSLPMELALAEIAAAKEVRESRPAGPAARPAAPAHQSDSPRRTQPEEGRREPRPAVPQASPRPLAAAAPTPPTSSPPPASPREAPSEPTPASQSSPATPREAPPAPGTPAPTGLAAISGRWREVLETARGLKPNLDALLRGSCEPVGLGDGVLTLGFFPNRQFHRDLLEKPENLRALEQAVSRVTGLQLRIKCAKEELHRGAARRARTHLIDAATQELGAVVMEEPEGPPGERD
ncbi:MAG: DNA polymerase III subunit gamma/tau [Dehalococcoidia bacterium]|nr:DNA polymerase III subunit gamma/tau [Dehalococcoidia bacterium]